MPLRVEAIITCSNNSVEAREPFGMKNLFHVGMLLGTEGRDNGCEPHYGIKKSLIVFWSGCGSDQASRLKICARPMFLGREWEI